jgi:hypothetical protein
VSPHFAGGKPGAAFPAARHSDTPGASARVFGFLRFHSVLPFKARTSGALHMVDHFAQKALGSQTLAQVEFIIHLGGLC